MNDSDHRGIWWFQVQPDGSLTNGDAIYRLEAPDESATGAAGMVLDSEDFFYVATNLGIQVFDPAGRVMAILQPPRAACRACCSEDPISTFYTSLPAIKYLNER